jgi:hypothetical protein
MRYNQRLEALPRREIVLVPQLGKSVATRKRDEAIRIIEYPGRSIVSFRQIGIGKLREAGIPNSTGSSRLIASHEIHCTIKFTSKLPYSSPAFVLNLCSGFSSCLVSCITKQRNLYLFIIHSFLPPTIALLVYPTLHNLPWTSPCSFSFTLWSPKNQNVRTATSPSPVPPNSSMGHKQRRLRTPRILSDAATQRLARRVSARHDLVRLTSVSHLYRLPWSLLRTTVAAELGPEPARTSALSASHVLLIWANCCRPLGLLPSRLAGLYTTGHMTLLVAFGFHGIFMVVVPVSRQDIDALPKYLSSARQRGT